MAEASLFNLPKVLDGLIDLTIKTNTISPIPYLIQVVFACSIGSAITINDYYRRFMPDRTFMALNWFFKLEEKSKENPNPQELNKETNENQLTIKNGVDSANGNNSVWKSSLKTIEEEKKTESDINIATINNNDESDRILRPSENEIKKLKSMDISVLTTNVEELEEELEQYDPDLKIENNEAISYLKDKFKDFNEIFLKFGNLNY